MNVLIEERALSYSYPGKDPNTGKIELPLNSINSSIQFNCLNKGDVTTKVNLAMSLVLYTSLYLNFIYLFRFFVINLTLTLFTCSSTYK